MKRNLNLIRLLLIEIEQSCSPLLASSIEIDTFKWEEVVYHIALMLDSDFIAVYEKDDKAVDYVITRLTNTGHDFVEFYRDEKTWEKALTDIKGKRGCVTFSMLVDYINYEW